LEANICLFLVFGEYLIELLTRSKERRMHRTVWWFHAYWPGGQ